MAMSGGTSKLVTTGQLGTSNATVKLYVYYKTAQNISKNQSTISCGMYIVVSDNYNIGSWTEVVESYVGKTSLTFNGAIPSNTKGTVWLAENKNFTVNHNTDGTGSAKIYWRWGVNSSWGHMEKPSGSISITLPKIARKSTFTATNAYIGNQSTITISRANNSFTHTLQYRVGSGSYTTIVNKTTATSYKWTIPENLYNSLSNGKVTINLRCVTYNGSTNLGDNQVNITATQKAASTITATNAYIGSQSTFSIQRNSGSFKHNLQYKIGNSSYTTIATGISDTSYKWTIPDSVYNSVGAANTYTQLTIKCITYYNNVKIGENESNVIKAMCNQSACKPTLSPVIYDVGTKSTQYTNDRDTIIKGYNSIYFNINAEAKKGASISKYKIVCGSKSASSATGNLAHVLSGTFTVSATDSRGFTASKTVTKPLVNYIKLTCALTAKASLDAATNKAVVSFKVSGNYYNGKFGNASGAVSNSLTVQYRYKTNSGSYSSWISLNPTVSNNTYSVSTSINNLDYQNKYTVQARAIDTIYSGGILSDEKSVSAKPIFDWGESDFNFNVPVKMPSHLCKSADDPEKCGLNMNNSDIVGLNCLWFNDSSNTVNEGLNFYRDGSNYDSLRAYNGRLLFTPDYPNSTAQYKLVYTTGDRFTITDPALITGIISGEKKYIYLTIPINRPILGNPTVSISGKLIMRGVNGYLGNADDSNSSTIDLSSTNKGFSYSAAVSENVGINITIIFDSEISNSTNNTPVVCARSTTLTITLS